MIESTEVKWSTEVEALGRELMIAALKYESLVSRAEMINALLSAFMGYACSKLPKDEVVGLMRDAAEELELEPAPRSH
jgi:hypothetical protein